MEARILRVLKCGECFTVKSEKSDDGLATLEYSEGDIVIATMRFQNREYNGQMYMDVVAVELIKK